LVLSRNRHRDAKSRRENESSRKGKVERYLGLEKAAVTKNATHDGDSEVGKKRE